MFPGHQILAVLPILARCRLAAAASSPGAGRIQDHAEGMEVPTGFSAYLPGVGVQAVEPSGLFRLSSRTLLAAARRDARVSWAIAGELNRRFYDTLEQTAVNAFGSVRQRVAAHLLDLASAQQESAGLAARVSQQELADAVGSVREVVARVLRELRVAGVIATAADRIVILDAARLYAESGGSAGL